MVDIYNLKVKTRSILIFFFLRIVYFPIIIFLIFISLFKKIRISTVREFLGNNNWLDLYIRDKSNRKSCNSWDFFYYEKLHLKKDFKKINFTFYNLLSREISLIPLEKKLTFLLFNNLKKFLVKAVYLYNIKQLMIRPLTGVYPKNRTEISNFYTDKTEKLIQISNKPVINIHGEDLKKLEEKFNYFNELNKEKKDLIVFVNRDPAYKKKQILNYSMEHNSFRDFSFSDYFKTLDYAKKKYFLFRGGDIVEKTYYADKNFVEYASSKNVCSENDIYSILKCKFFVGTLSGLDKIAHFFFKPMLLVNIGHLPCLKTWGNKTIFIPKKFYDTKKNKFITFKQLFDLNLLNSKKTGLPVGLYTTTNDFKENNIEVISNTPDEIFNAFTEMELFIEKKLIMSKEDKELQEKFWKLYPSRALSNKMIISPNFLRKNLTLLDYNI